MSKNSPAFPIQNSIERYRSTGLTKLEFFAMHFMPEVSKCTDEWASSVYPTLSLRAIHQAKILIRMLEEGQPDE